MLLRYCVVAEARCDWYVRDIYILLIKNKYGQLGPVWFLAILCQTKVWLPQFTWYIFVFCHTLASNILFSVWPICHRVIIVVNFCQSLASYFFVTPFMAAIFL
jgi:hypothetical protein